MATFSESMANSKSSRKQLEDMNIDEFMSQDIDFSSEDESPSTTSPVKRKIVKGQKAKEVTKVQTKVKAMESNSGDSIKKTKKKPDQKGAKKEEKKTKALDRLKEQDPDFYQFLQAEDKELLEDFDSGDSDDDDEDIESDSGASDDEGLKKFEEDILAQSDDDDRDSDEEKYHKLPTKLEVASDESDQSEDESVLPGGEGPGTSKSVTLKMVKTWKEEIKNQPSLTKFINMVQAFKAAVQSTSKDDEVRSKYIVKGGLVFNAIVRMCLVEAVPALEKILKIKNIPSLTDAPDVKKGKGWTKMKASIKYYFLDLMKLLSSISEPSMINVILKHIHKLIPIAALFVKLSRKLMKKCIEIWSSGEETSRVLAFLCINKMLALLTEPLLEFMIKKMYMAFVKNSKFTSPTTLPLISFMQRSLVEILLLNQVLAYQYAFIYIRQLAIHLRNAITVSTKESSQAVYNWQYIHCLGLWVKLLGTSHPSDTLQPLIYPVAQTIIGTLKLQPTTKFYPLRFHCVRALTLLSETTNTYIPVLPFLLEILEQIDFNKKHKIQSFKPLNFACILKLSKSQLEEKAFKEGLIDQLYELLMDHLKCHSHSIGFPELVLPTTLQLKSFLKKCKIANFCKQIKQIKEKIDENSKFIVQKRKYVNFTLEDDSAVETWERKVKEEGTPISKYYSQWRVMRDKELQLEISGKDRLTDVTDLPTIQRRKGPIKPTDLEKQEFAALFESDSDESVGDEERFKVDKKKPSQKSKAMTKVEDDNMEDNSNLSDFDSDELEKLAQSASEDEEDDEDDNEDDDEDDDEDEEEESDAEDNEDEDEEDIEEGDEKPKLVNRLDRKRKLLEEGKGKDDVVKEFRLDDF